MYLFNHLFVNLCETRRLCIAVVILQHISYLNISFFYSLIPLHYSRINARGVSYIPLRFHCAESSTNTHYSWKQNLKKRGLFAHTIKHEPMITFLLSPRCCLNLLKLSLSLKKKCVTLYTQINKVNSVLACLLCITVSVLHNNSCQDDFHLVHKHPIVYRFWINLL